jgi:hypothetical protein
MGNPVIGDASFLVPYGGRTTRTTLGRPIRADFIRRRGAIRIHPIHEDAFIPIRLRPSGQVRRYPHDYRRLGRRVIPTRMP